MNLQGKAEDFKGNKLCIGDYISLFAEDLFGFAWLFPSLTAPPDSLGLLVFAHTSEAGRWSPLHLVHHPPSMSSASMA